MAERGQVGQFVHRGFKKLEVESMGVVCKGISIGSDEKRSELYEFFNVIYLLCFFFFIGFGIFSSGFVWQISWSR